MKVGKVAGSAGYVDAREPRHRPFFGRTAPFLSDKSAGDWLFACPADFVREIAMMVRQVVEAAEAGVLWLIPRDRLANVRPSRRSEDACRP